MRFGKATQIQANLRLPDFRKPNNQLWLQEQINKAQQEKLIRDLEAEIRQIDRLARKGAITEKNADAQRDLQKLKKERLREGLTVEGEKRK